MRVILIQVFRCLGCLGVFTSRSETEAHKKRCENPFFQTLGLDEFLAAAEGKRTRTSQI